MPLSAQEYKLSTGKLLRQPKKKLMGEGWGWVISKRLASPPGDRNWDHCWKSWSHCLHTVAGVILFVWKRHVNTQTLGFFRGKSSYDHFQNTRIHTCIEGFCKCPRFEVVCRDSWPSTIMLGLMRRNASITTYSSKTLIKNYFHCTTAIHCQVNGWWEYIQNHQPGQCFDASLDSRNLYIKKCMPTSKKN